MGLHAQDMPYSDDLRKEIHFWKQIFTQYSQNQYLVHDSEDLTIVYKRVKFDSTVSRKQRERVLKRIKNDVKELLLRFHRGQFEADSLQGWERYVYDAFTEKNERNKFRNASKRIRAQQGIKENFLAGVRRSHAYLPSIHQVLEEEGLPREIAYLPHVESSFNPSARSHVGAAGMWQFMRATARQYMKVNRIRDDRYDPYISTRAAAKLLKYNHRVIKDWALAITAYNHGLGGMKRAKRRFGGNYMTIRDGYLRRSFGFASKNFYPEFLAVVEIMDSTAHYFPDIDGDEESFAFEIQLPISLYLNRFARDEGFDLELLKDLNPAYRPRVWSGRLRVPKGYAIRVPVDADVAGIMARLDLQAERIAQAAQERKAEQDSREHVIALGLSTLSKPDLEHNRVREVELAPWKSHQDLDRLIVYHESEATQDAFAASPVHVVQPLANSVGSFSETHLSADPSQLIAWGHNTGAARTDTKLGFEPVYNARVAESADAQGDSRVQASLLPASRDIRLQQVVVSTAENMNGDSTFLLAQSLTSAPDTDLRSASTHALVLESETNSRIEGKTRPSSYVAVSRKMPRLNASSFEAESGIQTVSTGDRTLTVNELKRLLYARLSSGANGIIVFPQETIGHFSEWTGIRASRIRQLNGVTRNQKIYLGQTLFLEFGASGEKSFLEKRMQYHLNLIHSVTKKRGSFHLEDHVVQPGENMWSLGRERSNLEVNLLLYFNDLNKLERLFPGDIVKLPIFRSLE